MQPAPSWLNLTQDTPWKALSAGLAAFMQYARVEIPKAIVRECKPIKLVRVK